jgi:acyl-CoA synthetase (AMP-forming)/AMP-acid ligase II
MINDNLQKNETGYAGLRSIEQANVSRHIVELAQVSTYKHAITCLSGRDTNGKMAYSHLTYRQLNQRSNELARGLQQAGVIRGTRAALQMLPGIEWFSIVYALLKIGAVPILLQPSLGMRKMAQCVKAVEPEILITEPKYQVIQMVNSSNYQSIHLQINTDKRWFSKGLSIIDLQKNEPATFQPAEMRSNDIGMIVFSTSCECDTPKPTVFTHGMLNAIIDLIRSVMAFSLDSTLITTFPLFMVLAPASGVCQIIPESHSLKANKLDPRSLIETIWDFGVSHLLMSSTRLMMLTEFLKNEAIFLPSIQRIASWGEPYPALELQRLHSFINEKTQIFPLYGMTEAPIISTLGSHKIVSETQVKTERGFGLCQGKVVEELEMRIIEVSDRPIDNWSDDLLVDDGGIGELVVKGDAVSRQYYNNSKNDALQKIPDGKFMWHRTGDIGWLDSRGNFWFCGRKQDRVTISEEETLYTIPCEAVFMQHDRVYRCIIVGVGPIPYQTPVLIIELAPGDSGKYISTLTHELLDLAQAYPHTGNIKNILFRKCFPVHSLYHQKINRKQLTKWAAKKLGKSLPDEAPEKSTTQVQEAIYPAALEEGQGTVLVADSSVTADLSQQNRIQTDIRSKASEPQSTISAPISETIDRTDNFQSETSTTELPDEGLIDPDNLNDNPPKSKIMTRIKSWFDKMIPKPDDDMDDSVDIEELPEEEYITADQYVALSESDTLKGQTVDNKTLLRSDYKQAYDSSAPLTQSTDDLKGQTVDNNTLVRTDLRQSYENVPGREQTTSVEQTNALENKIP